MDASGLPPCEDEINTHIKSALFFANKWATADQNHIEQHHTEENGWQLIDDHYKLIWFEGGRGRGGWTTPQKPCPRNREIKSQWTMNWRMTWQLHLQMKMSVQTMVTKIL